MLAYQVRLAWLSLRRNPVLSLLMVAGIGLGMALAMTSVAIYLLESGDPIPLKSDKLYRVQLDSWSPDEPFSSRRPEEPPTQLTWTDMVGIMKSDIPTYQSGMNIAQLSVHPDKEGFRPYRELVRMCFGDFFSLFDAPFRYGLGWDRAADLGPERVVVLDHETNQRLFGGEDSVGRTLRIEDRDFRIVGVMKPWQPVPRFYDTEGADNEPEGIYVPHRFGQEWELYSAGNTWRWTSSGDTYQEWLWSEDCWIQMWVQLDDERQKQDYAAFLAAYVLEQKKLGRFGRPLNNRLRDVNEWLESEEVVSRPTRTMLIISLLFLLVCSVDMIGILLGKFLARAPEVGECRRALGASRRWVFTQHLVECALVGLMGGLVGTALSVLGVRLVNRLFETVFFFKLDLHLLLAALLLALLSALIAGVYPAWRICRVRPALHLKTQ